MKSLRGKPAGPLGGGSDGASEKVGEAVLAHEHFERRRGRALG
jgi:hypothetical protein